MARNVLAKIEGTDPELKDQYVWSGLISITSACVVGMYTTVRTTTLPVLPLFWSWFANR